jgi:hypothetical protein
MTTAPSQHYPYPDHPLQTAGQRSWTDRNTSLDALHELEAVLAEPAPNRAPRWLANVRAALDGLHAALDAQAGGDRETTSLLSEIAVDEPRLVPRITRLRRQHDDLRESVRALRSELAACAEQDLVDVGDTRDRVADLARRLRHHRAQEADLIYEAVNLNLGTGD